MISLIALKESLLDDVGAVKGINVLRTKVIADQDWYPPHEFMSYELPFPSNMLRVRKKGTQFEGLYHLDDGLVLPCIFPSVKVLDTNDQLLSISRPRSPLKNIVCGLTGKLLFAGYVHLRTEHHENRTEYFIEVRSGKSGHQTHRILVFREERGDTFERIFTRAP
jgi:hypothetical protein